MIKAKNIDGVILILGVLSVFCLTEFGATLALMAALIIIGLPITIIIMVIPTLFVFILLTRLIQAALSFLGIKAHLLASAIAAIALMCVPPFLMNNSLHEKAQSYVSTDLTNPIEKRPIGTLAVVYPKAYNADHRCDDFCQRVLVNKQVKRVIRTHATPPFSSAEFSQKATVYWFEERATCPPVKVRNNVNKIRFRDKNGRSVSNNQKPSKFIRLNAAKGICFLSGPAKLSDADAIIFKATLNQGKSDFRAGLTFSADTVTAKRISYFQKINDKFGLAYQTTAVTYYKLWPVFTPSLITSGMQMKAGFQRNIVYLGAAKRGYNNPSFGEFVTKILGLKLSNLNQHTNAKPLKFISTALDKVGTLNPNVQTVVNDYFSGLKRKSPLSSADAKTVIKIFNDPRIRIPKEAFRAIENFPFNKENLHQPAAAALFKKIALFKPQKELHWKPSRYHELKYIGQAIEALPLDSFQLSQSNFQTLEKLAHNRVQRIFAYKTIKHLAQFNQKALPIFIYLINDARQFKLAKKPMPQAGHRNFRYQWELAHVAGIQGICEMAHAGFKDPKTVDTLLNGIKATEIPVYRGHKTLLANTLLGLGATSETIWQSMGKSFKTRAQFDKQIKRSKLKISCHYRM